MDGADPVAAYLAAVPPERAALVRALYDLVRRNLPAGYEEGMAFGMIGWTVPLSRYPGTYNGKPFLYAALANQKSHAALYLTGIYASEPLRDRFEAEYRATGKRFDVGKSCVRFKHLADAPLEVLGRAVASLEVDALVALAEAAKTK